MYNPQSALDVAFGLMFLFLFGILFYKFLVWLLISSPYKREQELKYFQYLKQLDREREQKQRDIILKQLNQEMEQKIQKEKLDLLEVEFQQLKKELFGKEGGSFVS